MIKEYRITESMIDQARRQSLLQGELNNSIMRGQGTVSGYLGEMIAAAELKALFSNTFNYDIILQDGRTVDVKTKQVSSPPRDYYSCSIANLSKKQDCDAYAFVRVKKDLSVGWYLGLIDKDDFFSRATEHKKGDYDPDNNFTFRADCYNLPISELE